MKLKNLWYAGIFLALLAALLIIAGYFLKIGPIRTLVSSALNHKTLLFFGGIMVLSVGVLGLFIYFRITKKPLKELFKSKPLVIFTMLAMLVVIVAGSYFIYDKKTPSSSQSLQTSQPNAPLIPTRNVLSVNYPIVKNSFSNQMLGVNFVNWEHSWGKPYVNAIPGLAQALKAAHVGLIRYAGGNWSNSVGWDRAAARTPNTGWPDSKNGPYWFHYNPAEIDSVAELAKSIGAEVMVEVNISTSDPAMWADMVKYTNVEHNYGFKYWELGNELDDPKSTTNPDTYNNRLKQYLDAMLDVDPTIRVIASGVSSPYEAIRQNYSDSITDLSQFLTKPYTVVSNKGRKIQALSYHWYQACNSTTTEDLTRFAWPGLADNSWRNSYSRKQADLMPQRIIKEITNGSIPQGVTELNFDSCNYENPQNGNFMNALWNTDVIGRMAYSGTNFATRWEGFGTQAYSFLYADNDKNPTKIMARPAYYAYLMYANYFGDQIVESSTNDNARLSIWAAMDSKDPTKLTLMVTNLADTDIMTTLNLPGFNIVSGGVYQLKSDKPDDMSPDSLKAAATINGVSVDPMKVEASMAAIKPLTLEASGSNFNYNFPAYSATALVLKGNFGPMPTPDPKAPPTPTIGVLPTSTPKPAPIYTISASTSTTKVNPGQSIDITTSIKVDNSNTTVLVDTEVYCSADNTNWSKDFQKARDNQKINAGQTQTYTDSWTVPPNHPKGQCVIKVGLFSPGWSKQLDFKDVGTFSIN